MVAGAFVLKSTCVCVVICAYEKIDAYENICSYMRLCVLTSVEFGVPVCAHYLGDDE